MTKEQNQSTSTDPKKLQAEVLELRHQLAELKGKNRAMSALLVEVSLRLQASSTSIKAAVSSLLDYDIFWDDSTQYEFLETIDNSVDQGANLIMLMALAFRSQASSLAISPEFHMLQEILSTVLDTLSEKLPKMRIKANFPLEGKPVFVDYGYLAVALRLMLEVLNEAHVGLGQVTVLAVEAEDCWYLNIEVGNKLLFKVIDHLCHDQFDDLMSGKNLSPENVLKLYTAFQIFHLQTIRLKVPANQEKELRLIIPTAN